MARSRHRTAPSVCRQCQRARRRGLHDHSCYSAVMSTDTMTWTACRCACQRTLAALGFAAVVDDPALVEPVRTWAGLPRSVHGHQPRGSLSVETSRPEAGSA